MPERNPKRDESANILDVIAELFGLSGGIDASLSVVCPVLN